MSSRDPARSGVSALIVNYASEEFLGPCLLSLARNPPSVGCDVVVVNNGSPSWDPDSVPDLPFPVEVINLTRNRGFAGATNIAAARAKGERLLLLNPDTVVLPEAIDRLVERLDSNSRVGAVAPRLLNADGGFQVSASRFFRPIHLPLLFDGVASKAFPDGTDPWIRLYRRYDRPRRVDWAVMAALLVKKEVWERLEGLDERFFLFAEDVDFSRRMSGIGMRILYDPNAVVVHHGMASAKKDLPRMFEEKERGLRTYYEIHFPRQMSLFLAFRARRRRFQERFEGARLSILGQGRISEAIKIVVLVIQLLVEMIFTAVLEALSWFARRRPR